MKRKNIAKLNPPSNIGIVGGGQLGRMFTVEAKRMGYNVFVLDPKANSPAGQIADEQIKAEFSDLNSLKELAQKVDVITYEFEHIDANALAMLEKDGHRIYPSSKTLATIQNKYTQKTTLNKAGIKVPDFYKIKEKNELKELFHALGGKVILKTCSGGYDGKGNIVITNARDVENSFEKLQKHELMVEEFIDFKKEMSIIVAKNHEKIAFYPVAENTHRNNILIKSKIPADISPKIESKIKNIARKVVETLDDYGVFCIEFFLDAKANVLVNEIAPRPHNSGHYTIEACVTSQYEQLLRIISGMPLGSTKLKSPCVMYNILGDDKIKGKYSITGIESLAKIEGCYLHLYGKAETAYLKKIGHITVLDEDPENADKKAKKALKSIKFVNCIRENR